MSIPTALTSFNFAKALVAAGIFTEDDMCHIERVVIVAEGQSLVTMHVQRYGDERLLEVIPLLTGAKQVDYAKAEPAGADTEPGQS